MYNIKDLKSVKVVRRLGAEALRKAKVQVLTAIGIEMRDHGSMVDEELLEALDVIFRAEASREGWDEETRQKKIREALTEVAPKKNTKKQNADLVKSVLSSGQTVLRTVESVLDTTLHVAGTVAGWGLKRVFKIVDGINDQLGNNK